MSSWRQEPSAPVRACHVMTSRDLFFLTHSHRRRYTTTTTTMMAMLRFLALFLLLVAAFAVKEPRTGIDFPSKYKGSLLEKLGVRTKGPIKVRYDVRVCYCDCRATINQQCCCSLSIKVYAVGQYSDTFLLKMHMGVGTEKMSGALSDALKPRCKNKEAIEDFESLLKKGCPKGVPKGMSLAFDTGRGKLGVSVNDKSVGSIGSKPLSQAFKGIYTDKNAVCKLYPVGEESGESDSGIGAFLTPRNFVVAGATVAIGYGICKYFTTQGSD